jgi:hypothetical protein
VGPVMGSFGRDVDADFFLKFPHNHLRARLISFRSVWLV